MATRTGTAVIVKASTLNHDDAERTTYYGPFLPHVGSATTWFIEQLERELEESGRYKHWDVDVETVFIAEGEFRSTRYQQIEPGHLPDRIRGSASSLTSGVWVQIWLSGSPATERARR